MCIVVSSTVVQGDPLHAAEAWREDVHAAVSPVHWKSPQRHLRGRFQEAVRKIW